MKQKRTLLLTVLVSALVLGLLAWRLWPRSLESLTGLDFDQVTTVSARLESLRYADGKSVTTYQTIEGEQLSPTGIKYSNYLMTCFEFVRCRPSLTNLLRPWLLSSFGWAGPVEQLHGFITCGDSHIHFTLTDRGQLIMNNRLYYINKPAFDALRLLFTVYGPEEVNES